MKNGLIHENGELVYYENGHPTHAGVVKIDGAIYYISSKGRAVKGLHIVHQEMTNDILQRGTYTFGDDYKLIEGSYIAPKKRNSIRRKIKRLTSEKWAGPLAAAVVLLFAVVAFIYFADAANSLGGKPGSSIGSEQTEQKIVLPVFDEPVLLCSKAAKQVYEHELTVADICGYGDPYRPFVFEYQIGQSDGVLLLGEDSAMTNAAEYILEQEEEALIIDNLKTGTTYYYQVVVDGTEYNGTFTTAKSTRFISIPGTENTRDIGGYTTLDGKTVRQGLLIRGPEIDGLVNAAYFIPKDSLKAVQDTFAFVYEFDLREPSIYGGTYISRLGNDVNHKFYGSPMYGGIFNDAYRPNLRQIFADLADPQKYPMYLHCTWGRDRTGTIVFLLQGVLNMSEQDMIQEYQLTGYTEKSFAGKNMDVIVSFLEPYDGETLQEKILTYLTTVIGVTEDEIASIRTIYLED